MIDVPKLLAHNRRLPPFRRLEAADVEERCWQEQEEFPDAPGLLRDFLPFTDDTFQDHLNNCRRCMALMVRSSAFNEDMTALIVTNNPLPNLKSNPRAFFTREQFGTKMAPRSEIPVQKAVEKEPPEPKATFPVEMAGKHLQFRFSTDRDFEVEGRFSKSYAEKEMKRQYPQLRYQVPPKPGPASAEHRGHPQDVSAPQQQPLRLSSLFKIHPVVAVPGDDGFRHGCVSRWAVNGAP
ncbi:testis-specific gene 13 protein [Eudromia elegans]